MCRRAPAVRCGVEALLFPLGGDGRRGGGGGGVVTAVVGDGGVQQTPPQPGPFCGHFGHDRIISALYASVFLYLPA